jgi:hypothetical protein
VRAADRRDRRAGRAPGQAGARGRRADRRRDDPVAADPPKAAKLQRSIGTLGNGNLLAGTGLLICNALLDRIAFTDPPKRRIFSKSRL